MERDEVLRLAREAWRDTGEGWTALQWFDARAASFQRFAALISAAELAKARQILVDQGIVAAVAAEREACLEDVRTVGGQFAVECEALMRKRWGAA